MLINNSVYKVHVTTQMLKHTKFIKRTLLYIFLINKFLTRTAGNPNKICLYLLKFRGSYKVKINFTNEPIF